ncbi:acetylserotonin O-methyltransferase [Amycolatopsis rubida]|uniref:acetylserotonin O-methyltransferase n=1 Tax=Amycolatopsis rubida TaxID=112413 RepID=UPI001FCB0B81|nr:acetylserotonin O-methyltransferase [Amycolatopsis rubida]
MRTNEVDADWITRTGTAFCSAKILLTALELGVFEAATEDTTEPELRTRLGLHPRASLTLLQALVSLGLLRRRGEHYRNAPAAQRHLVRSEPSYRGGYLLRANHMLYPAWGRLTEAVRSGEPQVDLPFAEMTGDPARLRRYLDMMDSLSAPVAEELVRSVDWSIHRRVLDVGGARGNLVSLLALAHPHLEVGVFDLPQMEAPFHEHTSAHGLAERATFHPGDFFRDPLPEHETIVIGHVLHNWAPEQRQAIVAKAAEALPPGGTLLVYDQMIAAGLSDPESLITSLTMLLTTDGGAEYSAAQCEDWMKTAGLRPVSAVPIGVHDFLVRAERDG